MNTSITDRCNDLIIYLKNVNSAELGSEVESEINKQLDELKNSVVKGYTSQYMRLIQSLSDINIVSRWSNLKTPDILKQIENELQEYIQKTTYMLNAVVQLETIGRIFERNIVIVGANGAGKSSFANYLSENNFFESITNIPAQKLLYTRNLYKSEAILATNIQEYQEKIKLKSVQVDTDMIDTTSESFEDLINAVVNEDTQSWADARRGEENSGDKIEYFDTLRKIFQKLFVEIDLKMVPPERSFLGIKQGNQFAVNSLSDGEKAAIYYILNVLFTKKSGYIIVDEPETYLNQNISSKLWNLLREERPDCQFIFITHNVDFINSQRFDSKILWLKDGNLARKNWTFEEINDVDMPSDLLLQLLGNRKKVLFIEGKKTSKDYRFYESLFGEDFTIYPSGGCRNVISYVKEYNKNNFMFNNGAVGIVDLDFRTDKDIKKLNEAKIFVNNSANEIEMALLLPDILRATVKKAVPLEDTDEVVENFMAVFQEYVVEHKDTIIFTEIKNRIEEQREFEKLDKPTSLESLRKSYKNLSKPRIFYDVVREVRQAVNDTFSNRMTYETCLKISNHKNELRSTLAGVFKRNYGTPINDYYEVALRVLNDDKELARTIREKYYPLVGADITQK